MPNYNIGLKRFISLLIIMLLFSLASFWESRQDNNWSNIEDEVTMRGEESKIALLSLAKAEALEKTRTEVTVYHGLALVKEYRIMNLRRGYNIVKYADVASMIDPASVMFRDTKSPNTIVVEQNYEYDLVSADKLMNKYLNKTIKVTSDNITFTGKLLGYTGGITLQTQQGIIVLNKVDRIEYPDTSYILTKPTLIWQIYTDTPGSREVETTYLTDGMDWNANYIIIVQNDTTANIKGWVTIENRAGASYPDAKLKLVAGEINRIYQTQREALYEKGYPTPTPVIGELSDGFREAGLFEYHIYTLQRPTTLNNNEIKQISLLSADEVPVTKEYSYDGLRYGEKVRVTLNITNSRKNGLGIPLPKGVVRVYKADNDGQLQFLGEDSIDHTPKDENLRINVGNAFDVMGKRTVMHRERLGSYGLRESYQIKLKNHKNEEVKITVIEHLHGDWEITKASEQYRKRDANTIEFVVNIPKDGSKTITYTAEFR